MLHLVAVLIPESFNVLSVGSSPAPVTPPQDGACLNSTTSNKVEKVLTVINTINYNLLELNKIKGGTLWRTKRYYIQRMKVFVNH